MDKQSIERETLEQDLRDKLSEILGMEVEDMDPSLHLEAELGLDSLKMLGLWNNLLATLPAEVAERVAGSGSPGDLVGLQTLGELMELFLQQVGGASSAEAAGQTVPATGAVPPQAVEESLVSPEDPGGRPLPMANAQKLFLLTYQLVGSTSLCSALRLTGVLDREALGRAWQRLVERHVNLRTCFYIPPGCSSFAQVEYRLLDAPRVPAVEFVDLQGLPPGQGEERIEQEFDRLLNRNWDLRRWPLHQFSLLRTAADEHLLLLSNEHIVSDGLGNQTLLREVLALYQEEAGGAKAELPAVLDEAAYRRRIEQINAYVDPDETAAFERFKQKQGRENYRWDPDRRTLDAPLPHFVNRKYELDRAATAALAASAERSRTSLYSLLVGAFLRVVSRNDPSQRTPIIQLPTSGIVYPEVDLQGEVGCFAQNLSLRFPRPAPAEQPLETAARVHTIIEGALAWGYDRELTHQMAAAIDTDFTLKEGRVPAYVLAQLRQSLKSNLYFPFTGHSRIAERYAALRVSDYRAGTTNVVGVVDILQEIHGERLHIFVNFDRQGFSDRSIEGLVAAYREELAAMARPAAAAAKAAPEATAGTAPVEELLRIAGEVLSVPVDESRLDEDLETRLGVDSLERIRLVTRLGKHYRADRRKLFACRTLGELARAIGAGAAPAPSSSPAPAVAKSPAPPVMPATPTPTSGTTVSGVAAPPSGGAVPEPRIPEAEGIDPALPPLPYRHIMAQAQRTPDAVAVKVAGRQITYRELDESSSRLARYLSERGIGSGDLVGIMSRRGPDMLVGILGILKSGAAYVPVDPDYPEERIRYILGHAQARFLLTQAPLLPKLEGGHGADQQPPVTILLDADAGGEEAAWRQSPATPPEPPLDPHSLMVVLYTSGSTGRPKGVALDHLGYINRLAWHQKVFQLRPGERVAQKTSCCFDISVWELFWPLMTGGVVCAIERDQVRNPWVLSAWMQEERINIMHFVPSMFVEFVHAHEGEILDLPDLRWLIFSGEVLPVSIMQEWIDRQGLAIGLANLYGPTEASIDVTYCIIDRRPPDDQLRIPIGKAIDNVQLLVLDEEGNALPPGEQGELTLGGIQLAHGYLRDPEKTAKAFVPNIYPGIPGKHVYRTGDLAVMLADGTVDYLGRIDSQVKLRGYRVELGEIEGVMGAFPGVSEAAALAITLRDQTKLVAWYAGSGVDEDALREWVGRRLADYMMPQILIPMERLPKNHNGKLDRNALRAAFEAGETGPAAGKQRAAAARPAEPREFLPLSPAQKWLVSYFDEPFRWWGYSRLVLHDRLDIDAFVRALELLIAQHPALRTVFEKRGGQWVKRPLARPPRFEPELYEARTTDPEERDRLIREAIQQAAERLRIDRWPLLAVLVVKVHQQHYDISVVSHHMIGDLVAGNLMARNLWQYYRALQTGQTPQAPPVPGSNKLTARLEAMEEEGDLESHLEYWRRTFPAPGSGFDFPVDHALGENVEASAAVDRFNLDKEETLFLLSKVKAHFGCSLYHLLLTPLYRLLAERSDRRRVVLSQRVNGRDALGDHVFFDSVDNFAVNYPLALELDPGEPPEATIAHIRQALDAVPLKGISYDWLGERLPFYLYSDAKLTPIRVNYLGNISVPSSTTLELRPEDNNQRLTPGSQCRPCMIECWFSVLDERLRLEIGYSTNFYRAETIEELGEDYLQRLRGLIDLAREAGE